MSIQPPPSPSIRAASPAAAGVQRNRQPGLDLTIITRPRLRELHLTLRPQPGDQPTAMFDRLGATLAAHEAVIVKQEVFGSLDARVEALEALRRACGSTAWPLTWVEGADCGGAPIAGTHVLAVAGAEVQPLTLDGRLLGAVYQDGAARHCWLGDLSPQDCSRSPAEQTRQAYALLAAALQQAGMDMTQVVRTWFYLDDILAWYDAFNEVRADCFRRHQVFDQLVPASTGVGARNPSGAAVALGVWAVEPLNGVVTIREVASPLQCPAPTYGSSFSRAVEVATPECRQLLISGTASIEPGGRSVHAGAQVAQVALTLRVLQGLLDSRQMSLRDVSRGSAYCKHSRDAVAFAQWCDRHQAAFLPVICNRSAVCRDELLFELELDAVVPTTPQRKS